MSQDTDNRMEQPQAQVAALDQLQRALLEAQESLDREIYQLDLTETRLQMAEDEIRKLESFTLTSLVCSLVGNRIGRIDELREQCRTLERQRQEQTRAAEEFQQQVEQLNGQIAGLAGAEAQLRALCPADTGSPHSSGSSETADEPRTVASDLTSRIERAIEAGESLLTHLDGSYRVCNGLKRGPGAAGRTGALIAGAMQAYRDKNATSLTGQIAESVRRFCDQAAAIELTTEDRAGAEILAALSQIRRFADSGGTILGTESETWAELEILARGLVTDLQDMLSHRTASRS